jgi:alpha-tubulin suppressor-like RCC1 family protein
MSLLQIGAAARQDQAVALNAKRRSGVFSLTAFAAALVLLPSIGGEAFADDGKKIVAVAAGYVHSLALGKDGMIYAAGSNFDGETGLDNAEYRNVFTEVKF